MTMHEQHMDEWQERLRRQCEVMRVITLAVFDANEKGLITDWTMSSRLGMINMEGDRVFLRFMLTLSGKWELSALSFDDWQPVFKQVSPEQAADMIRTMTPEQILEWLRQNGEER